MEEQELHSHRHRHRSEAEHGGTNAFLPLLLLTLSLFGWFCFQATQLLGERADLRRAHNAQQAQVQQSQQVRDSLDALARDTALLANQGNRNAQLVVDELRKRGVTINPNSVRAPQ